MNESIEAKRIGNSSWTWRQEPAADRDRDRDFAYKGANQKTDAVRRYDRYLWMPESK